MNLRKKGYLFSVLATLASAATYIFSKYSLRYMDSIILTLVWMSCGAVFCFAWSVARSGTRSIKLRRNYAWMVVGVGVLSAFAMVACFVSVDLLDPTVAALFGRLDLVFVVGISIVFLKERFNLMEGLGFAVVVVGILILVPAGVKEGRVVNIELAESDAQEQPSVFSFRQDDGRDLR